MSVLVDDKMQHNMMWETNAMDAYIRTCIFFFTDYGHLSSLLPVFAFGIFSSYKLTHNKWSIKPQGRGGLFESSGLFGTGGPLIFQALKAIKKKTFFFL